MPTKKREYVLTRPADKSLDAYKKWYRGLLSFFGFDEDLSDEEYEEDGKHFWHGPARDRGKGPAEDELDDRGQP